MEEVADMSEILEDNIMSPIVAEEELDDGDVYYVKAVDIGGMEETESDIESEFLTAGELCPMCLASERLMLPLSDEVGSAGAYTMLLAGFFDEDRLEAFAARASVCWECHGALRRTLLTRQRALDACVALRACRGLDVDEVTFVSLSRLVIETSVGFDLELVHEEPPEPESSESEPPAPRRRGRPRKHPSPAGRQPTRKRKAPPARSKVLRKGRAKRQSKFVRVHIGASELDCLREADRASAPYASAAYRCDTCIKSFTFVSLLEKHMRDKHSEEAGEHECAVCAVRFADEPALRRHRERHYRLHSCAECGFTAASLGAVVRHNDETHEPGKTYSCGECGEVFPRERKLRYHKEITHKQKYQCEYCQKVYPNVQAYKGHVKIHTGMPTLECSLCGKACRGENGLYAHMRTAHSRQQSAEEAYCVECQVQFRNRDGLRYHLKNSVRHASPAELRYECEQCSKKFLSERALRHHHQYYHCDYVCNLCGKKLNSRYTFSKHMKFVHEGHVLPRKHVCDVCGKAFKSKIQLQTHLLTHTGERPHACGICGARFAQRSTLSTHRRLVHYKMASATAAAAAT